MKYIFFIVVGLVGISLVGGLLRVLFFPVNTASKLIDTAYDAQDKVLNAENAIYNYEWFKQKYQDIEATKRQYSAASKNYDAYVDMLGSDRSTWGFEDKNEVARLNSVQLGLQTNLESQIGDYNARASMATRNIFEDSVLPSYIDALTFIKQ